MVNHHIVRFIDGIAAHGPGASPGRCGAGGIASCLQRWERSWATVVTGPGRRPASRRLSARSRRERLEMIDEVLPPEVAAVGAFGSTGRWLVRHGLILTAIAVQA